MNAFVLHGNFIWSDTPQKVRLRPDAYAVCDENGLCAGVFDALPPIYADLHCIEAGPGLVVPGYSDLHLHAAQYRNMGQGMDLQLVEWLSTLTYPEEARFADPDFARSVYGRFIEELRTGFTTRAVMFASAHTEATLALMDLAERSGLVTYIGRVNMDRNAPDIIREPSAKQALADTIDWLDRCEGRYTHTKPIITPRFVPSCTPELLESLGRLSVERKIPVQSHLDEQIEEVAWVRELCPESIDYADVYDKAGMLRPDTIMAHCIYMTERETALLRDRGVFIAHCPMSNSNVRSGIAPIRKYMDLGLNIGLGTDISGGHSLDLCDAVREALSVSRLLWCMSDEKPAHLHAEEAFYLATAGGGAYFGRVGRFAPGYAFDAVLVDDSAWRESDDKMDDRFRKLIYRADAKAVRGKFVEGRRVF